MRLQFITVALLVALAVHADDRTTVSTFWLWSGQSKGATPTDPMVRLMKEDPSIRVTEWTGLELPGAAGRIPLMLGIAGQTAPDLYKAWFHIARNDINQGFAAPLNEWIGEDANGDGDVAPEEARWSGWRDVPPLWRQVATKDGRIYGLPLAETQYMGVIYRLDLARQAGLNPARPPKTWDEFLYWSQKLTNPGKAIPGAKVPMGQRGFALMTYGFTWLPWLNSAGGTPVTQTRVSPTTGARYTFPMDATGCVAADTGEDLSHVAPEWQAALGSDQAVQATGFFHRLRWQRWIRDPRTGEPINLTPEQVQAGRVSTPDGRTVSFAGKDVITGAIRTVSGGPDDNWGQWLARGEVAMVQWFFNDLSGFQTSAGVNPDLLGVFAIPAAPGQRPVVQLQRHFAVMSEGVARRPKAERDAVWTVMTRLTSSEAYDESVRRMVLSGRARFANPRDLARLGYKDYLAEVPPSLRQLYADMDSGAINLQTEPSMGFWASMDMAVKSNVLQLVVSQSGEQFDYATALKETERTANAGVMFARKPDDLAPHRPLAWGIFGVVALGMCAFVGLIVRTNLQARVTASAIASRSGVYRPWMPWLLLFPALALIAMWGYYPLARGAVMAFQDYHVVGQSPYVGMDNFINILLTPDFYVYVGQTLKYVVLSLLLVFTTPIMLSLLLAEVPRGKVFWRSIFFLPQLTSGLVIALLWKLMYSPTEHGILNQAIGLFGAHAYDWLGDKQTAMVATILPTVWAGMGMASLIYLAALKSIPEEIYEAADLDGAGPWTKLWRITIPQLAPLIIINFIGAFIGTFQSMGNIFLLTFGGPGKETMVMSMAIWLEAYTNLRFSTATAMGWIMGSALIGFAYLQIRMLRKVEYRRAEEV